MMRKKRGWVWRLKKRVERLRLRLRLDLNGRIWVCDLSLLEESGEERKVK